MRNERGSLERLIDLTEEPGPAAIATCDALKNLHGFMTTQQSIRERLLFALIQRVTRGWQGRNGRIRVLA